MRGLAASNGLHEQILLVGEREARQVGVLVPVVPHDDDRHIRPPGERCGFLHRRRNHVRRVLPAQAYLAANQTSSGKLPGNGSILLRSVGCIVDPQRVRLACDQVQRHRLGFQRDAWIVDEQLTIQVQAGRPQMGQRERVVPGHWRGEAALSSAPRWRC